MSADDVSPDRIAAVCSVTVRSWICVTLPNSRPSAGPAQLLVGAGHDLRPSVSESRHSDTLGDVDRETGPEPAAIRPVQPAGSRRRRARAEVTAPLPAEPGAPPDDGPAPGGGP